MTEISMNLGIDQIAFHTQRSTLKALEQVIADRSFSKYPFQWRAKINIGSRVPKKSSLRRKSLFYECDYFCKNFRMTDGKVGESLSINLDILSGQKVDKRRVGQSKGSNCRVDSNIPKSSESSLFCSSVDVGVGTSLGNSILYSREYVSIH